MTTPSSTRAAPPPSPIDRFHHPSYKYAGEYVPNESVRNMSVDEFMKSIGGKTYKLGDTLVPGVVVGGIMKRPNFKRDPSLYQAVKACATLAIDHYNESQLEPESKYQVVEIDEVDEISVAGSIFYITFKAKRAGQELESIPAEKEELSTFKAEVFNGIDDKDVRSVWKLDGKTSNPCFYVLKEGIQERMKEAAQFSAAAIDISASPVDDVIKEATQESEEAALNKSLDGKIEVMKHHGVVLKEFEGKIHELEAEIAGLEGKLELLKQLGHGATKILIEELEGKKQKLEGEIACLKGKIKVVSDHANVLEEVEGIIQEFVVEISGLEGKIEVLKRLLHYATKEVVEALEEKKKKLEAAFQNEEDSFDPEQKNTKKRKISAVLIATPLTTAT
ncbi:hypothetical protein OROGR_023420 [Orobanche gracilis]